MFVSQSCQEEQFLAISPAWIASCNVSLPRCVFAELERRDCTTHTMSNKTHCTFQCVWDTKWALVSNQINAPFFDLHCQPTSRRMRYCRTFGLFSATLCSWICCNLLTYLESKQPLKPWYQLGNQSPCTTQRTLSPWTRKWRTCRHPNQSEGAQKIQSFQRWNRLKNRWRRCFLGQCVFEPSILYWDILVPTDFQSGRNIVTIKVWTCELQITDYTN